MDVVELFNVVEGGGGGGWIDWWIGATITGPEEIEKKRKD